MTRKHRDSGRESGIFANAAWLDISNQGESSIVLGDVNKLFSLGAVAFAFVLSGHFSPLAAQYNPPPPPEQQNTGEPPSQDQQAGGPPDGPQPMQDDQSAPPPPQQSYTGGQPGPDQGPPPDQAPGPDQGAPDEGAPPPDAGDNGGDANFQTFYNNLSSQGDWIQTDNYGYVWQPNVQDPDWRPYSDGHWVYTDEGWTWVADDSEPWGWATYHYGRWANIDGRGWVWVPGYTWAPAWVSWRYGGGYCGWAPLPPDTFVGIDFGGVGLGFHIGGDCDTAYDIGPGYYNFIPVGYIGERDYRRHYLDRNNNFTIINNTRNVTNINVNNQRGAGRFSRVSVGGPNFSTINAQSTTPVQRVRLARSNRVGNASLQGNQLSVFAPRVNATNANAFRPSHVAGTVHNARVNPGASLSQPLQVNAHVRAPAPSAAQISAAQNTHFSSNARVATPGEHPSSTLTRPLNSYQPHESRRTANVGEGASSVQGNRMSTPAVTGAATHESSFTGEGGPESHHTGSNTVNHAVNREETEAPHATTVQHTGAPQAQEVHSTYHSEAAPVNQAVHPQTEAVQHEETHPQTEVRHEESHPQAQEEHHEAIHPQESHQESHPPAEQQHFVPPPQHASAPPPHAAPSGGGGGGGHPGGNGNDDNKQQH